MSDFDVLMSRLAREISIVKVYIENLEKGLTFHIENNMDSEVERLRLVSQNVDIALQSLDGLQSYLLQVGERADIDGLIDFDIASSCLKINDMKLRLCGIDKVSDEDCSAMIF